MSVNTGTSRPSAVRATDRRVRLEVAQRDHLYALPMVGEQVAPPGRGATVAGSNQCHAVSFGFLRHWQPGFRSLSSCLRTKSSTALSACSTAVATPLFASASQYTALGEGDVWTFIVAPIAISKWAARPSTRSSEPPLGSCEALGASSGPRSPVLVAHGEVRSDGTVHVRFVRVPSPGTSPADRQVTVRFEARRGGPVVRFLRAAGAAQLLNPTGCFYLYASSPVRTSRLLSPVASPRKSRIPKARMSRGAAGVPSETPEMLGFVSHNVAGHPTGLPGRLRQQLIDFIW